MLEIHNDGPLLASTNYWQTDLAKTGKVYLSINAGCFRLLVPDALAGEVADMCTARVVVISRGPWPAAGLTDALEVLFEDGTDNPYALHFGVECVDRLPLDADAGKVCTFEIYIRGPQRRFTCPAHYRLSRRLPDLKPLRG